MANEEESKNEEVKPEAEAVTPESPAAEDTSANEVEAKAETEAKTEAAVEAKAEAAAEGEKPAAAEGEKPVAAATSEAASTEEKPKKARAKKTKTKSESGSSSSPVSISLDDPIEKPKIIRAKGSKNVTSGIAHVQATFNNTLVSITDQNGNVLGWSSAGKCGFKGSRKSTAYAAQMVAQDACRQAMGHGLKAVEVRVKGPGSGRESAVRAMQAIGLEITTIKDVTPVPHNGCRPPKQRRV